MSWPKGKKYDEPYWHQNREEVDRKRQEEIEKDGWKFLRYSKLPEDIILNKNLMELCKEQLWINFSC